MKRTLILVVILIIVAAGVGYYLWNKKTPDVAVGKPDTFISATDLIAAFDKDTASASKLYVNKLLRVTGLVKSVDTAGAVVLGDSASESSVVCGLDRRHVQEAAQVKVGAKVTVQGRCTGYQKGEEMMGISLGTTVQLAFAGILQQSTINQ